ncbi:MAG TPA: class II aldolase/adducin family protein [Candidatus Sulfotelmatobacter sp.]|jgi:L-fuculose-phosphate aldolase|nr:class II aldolase/adducin family protein [Candidatus Sulfotelmatobacter sp.]
MTEQQQIRSTRHRLSIIDTLLKLEKLGLNKGMAGNVSVRWGDGFLVTPSGMPAGKVHPEDIVLMSMDGSPEGRRKPSSEWRFHRDIYASRPEIGAVVHTHAPFCVSLAVLHKSIPSYHYMVAKAGGKDIRCAPYATYGTQDLSDHVVKALEGRLACLMANHGMIAVGVNLDAAVTLAVEVEELAEGYWRALQIGQPVLLDDAEMDVVLEKFKGYGANAQKG